MIHKEGTTILLLVGTKMVVLNLVIWWIWPEPGIFHWSILTLSTVAFLFFLQFFRNPKRVVEQNENQVIAPADGKIVVIEKTEEEEFLKSQRIQISIFMSPINVHVNRNPVSGMVKYYRYHKGKYLVAWHPKSSSENERTTVVYEMANGVQLLCRQIAGMAARRIKCYLNEGDTVVQGEEFGFIKFGSRVDIFLPVDASVKVKIGEVSVGGKTVLAELG